MGLTDQLNLLWNPISDIGLVAYATSSGHLYNLLEGDKSIPFVDDIEFAEIVKVMHTRQVNSLKKHLLAQIKMQID
jgi:hypothetical protein